MKSCDGHPSPIQPDVLEEVSLWIRVSEVYHVRERLAGGKCLDQLRKNVDELMHHSLNRKKDEISVSTFQLWTELRLANLCVRSQSLFEAGKKRSRDQNMKSRGVCKHKQGTREKGERKKIRRQEAGNKWLIVRAHRAKEIIPTCRRDT